MRNYSLGLLSKMAFYFKRTKSLTRAYALVLLIIIIIIIVSFMQGSHTHIPETSHVPRGCIVAAILSLLFMLPLCLVPALALLFFYVSTFRSMCAVPNMAVFCSSLTLRLLMSYIYGAPSKARNVNVVYIWT